MCNTKLFGLGLLVQFLAMSQAESFKVSTVARSLHPRCKIDIQCKSFAHIRGGQSPFVSNPLFDSINKGNFAAVLGDVLHTFVDPTITGGFLSGGLHAVTGTYCIRTM
jgi:hypothetical protein